VIGVPHEQYLMIYPRLAIWTYSVDHTSPFDDELLAFVFYMTCLFVGIACYSLRSYPFSFIVHV